MSVRSVWAQLTFSLVWVPRLGIDVSREYSVPRSNVDLACELHEVNTLLAQRKNLDESN